MPLRILLLQARHQDDPERQAEVVSFAEKCGLSPEQFKAHDLLSGPLRFTEVRRFDALMVGGSGDFYVSRRNLPFFAAHLEALQEVVEAAQPTFASCFGFQLLVEALGGEIVYDPDSIEVGTYDLSLTRAGREDPLMGHLPHRFAAQMGRKDRAQLLPPGVPNLASSERNPHQAFRLPEKPIWATQFHPELDELANLQRFKRYMDGYAQYMSPTEREEAFARYRPSPETATLLPRFLELIFG